MNKKSIIAIFFVSLLSTFYLEGLAQHIGFPVDTTYNVQSAYRKIKARFPEAVPAIDSSYSDLNSTRNIVYAKLGDTKYGPRDLHLDVFRPSAHKELLPAVVMVHGGGWRSGTRHMQVPMAQLLARKGYVTIPVEYQLSLEASFPAPIHNIKAAIRWIKAHADAYGIDTTRIAISGCSAGGHLAALVGLTDDLPQFVGDQGNNELSSRVHAIVDMDGILSFLTPTSLNVKQTPESIDVIWMGGTFAEKPLVWKDASPIFWANKDSAKPMLFLNSGFFRYHAGQDDLIGIMNDLGMYTEVHKFDVQLHPFWLFHPWVDRAVDLVSDFLHAQL